MIDELILLLDKIAEDEDLINRAEEYFIQYHRLWSGDVAAYFEDMLERKRDQLYYEKDRLEKMGQAIATDRDRPMPDI